MSTAGLFIERIRKTVLDSAMLDAIVAGTPTGRGALLTKPLYLVCTHGRFGVLCARWGRPIARAMADEVGDRTWETTHVSGCHLAANVVCLPSGTYYSRVVPAAVPAIVAATEAGEIAEPWYRGRVELPLSAP